MAEREKIEFDYNFDWDIKKNYVKLLINIQI
jgi:hypothetical protein